MLCPKCGENNLDDARFCKNCGTPLEKTAPTPPPPPAPTRSPLEGLGSPSETMPTPQTSFTASTPKTPKTKAEPAAAAPPPPPPTTSPAETTTKTPPPPPTTAPTETKTADPPPPSVEVTADVTPPPPQTAPPVESATVYSPPPPPPTVGQAPAPEKKSQKKPLLVCLSIVGIVFLLFMLLVIAAMCMGNTHTSRLSGPGDSYTFTVDVSEPVQVTFEVPEDVQFNVNITGPQGDFVGEWTINPFNNVFTLKRNGTYTFLVYSVSGSGWWKAKW
ncbi:MAG: zinc ribbon domain-containing protein [Deltaproteobacteria bacterium]|nr:zinc ribbon domain-containing protein [Candidatus Zymogenaceae bacterium]